MSLSISGTAASLSHLYTDWRDTPSLSPRLSWLSPNSFRFSAMRCPMVISSTSFVAPT